MFSMFRLVVTRCCSGDGIVGRDLSGRLKLLLLLCFYYYFRRRLFVCAGLWPVRNFSGWAYCKRLFVFSSP